MRASQPNAGLRIILLTILQISLWPVKLKISIILALCVFPRDDSCNFDSPFLMYTKKVEAMKKGKGKENMANFKWKMTFPFFFNFFNFFVLFPLFKFKHLHSLILPNQTKSHRGLEHISRCPADMKISCLHRTKGAVYAIQLEKIFLLSFFQQPLINDEVI